MTKDAALFNFFSSFGIEVYPTSYVPADAAFPYLWYSVSSGNWYSGPMSMTVQVVYYTSKADAPTAKAQEILDAIGTGIYLHCDNGAIFLYQGNVPRINTTGEGDENVKVRQLDIMAQYLTPN